MFLILENHSSNDLFEGSDIDLLIEACEELNNIGRLFVELMQIDFNSHNVLTEAREPNKVLQAAANIIRSIVAKISAMCKSVANAFRKVWLFIVRRSGDGTFSFDSKKRDRYFFNYDEYCASMQDDFEEFKKFYKNFQYDDFGDNGAGGSDAGSSSKQSAYDRPSSRASSAEQKQIMKSIKAVNGRLTVAINVFSNNKILSGKATLADIQKTLEVFENTDKFIKREMGGVLKGINIESVNRKYKDLYDQFQSLYKKLREIVDKGEAEFAKSSEEAQTPSKSINYPLVTVILNNILTDLTNLQAYITSYANSAIKGNVTDSYQRVEEYDGTSFQNIIVEKQFTPDEIKRFDNDGRTKVIRITTLIGDIEQLLSGNKKSITNFEEVQSINNLSDANMVAYRTGVQAIVQNFATISKNFKSFNDALANAMKQL